MSKILIGVPLEDIGNTESGMFHEMFIDSQGVDFLNYHQDTSGIQGRRVRCLHSGSTRSV